MKGSELIALVRGTLDAVGDACERRWQGQEDAEMQLGPLHHALGLLSSVTNMASQLGLGLAGVLEAAKPRTHAKPAAPEPERQAIPRDPTKPIFDPGPGLPAPSAAMLWTAHMKDGHNVTAHPECPHPECREGIARKIPPAATSAYGFRGNPDSSLAEKAASSAIAQAGASALAAAAGK